METRIYTKQIFAIVLGALLLIGGCTKEAAQPDASNNTSVSLQINVATVLPISRALNIAGATGMATRAQESAIDKVRMILFSCDASGVVRSLITNRLNSGGMPFTQSVRTGYVRIILIANELDSWNLQNITTIEQLHALTFLNDLTPTTTPPLTMYSDTVVNVTQTQYNFTIQLVNTVAKVALNLFCDYGVLGEGITIRSISVRNMPKVSYLITQQYNGSGFFSSPALAMDYASGNVIYTADSLKTKAGGVILYIPEYKAVNPSNYTYIEILAAPINNPSRTLTYRILLGDGIGKLYTNPPVAIGSLTAQDISITRNNRYTINATIKSIDMVDLAVKVNVVDWTLDNNTNGWLIPPHMNISTIKVNFDRAKPFRIYFWTNQQTAYIFNTIYVHRAGLATATAVADTFIGLPTGVNFNFNAATGAGYIDFALKPTTTYPLQINDVLKFSVNGGNIRRTIDLVYVK